MLFGEAMSLVALRFGSISMQVEKTNGNKRSEQFPHEMLWRNLLLDAPSLHPVAKDLAELLLRLPYRCLDATPPTLGGEHALAHKEAGKATGAWLVPYDQQMLCELAQNHRRVCFSHRISTRLEEIQHKGGRRANLLEQGLVNRLLSKCA